MKEAMKLALEALESVTRHFTRTPSTLRDSEVRGEAHKAITALREALAEQPAQQEQHPVWRTGGGIPRFKQPAQQQESVDSTQISKAWWDGEKLMENPIPFVEFYKPAQRTWVGLTDEEKTEIRRKTYALPLLLMEAIEAKLKEKNT